MTLQDVYRQRGWQPAWWDGTEMRPAAGRLLAALDALPAEYREVIVLRELEELSYKEIAEIAGIPIGTVMSRLARARRRLQESVLQGSGK